ncbi:MAG: bifunctional oligoribonuclease/PAP phosphatase NrnA [Deltaproteobacteria bacterium]|nr:bifunctional oligoribonuclease/PAP phosphatase NrnA [Deltaproteobacteria bacterium]
MDKIVNQLKNSRNVLITSHVNPDGDAIGSLVAMGLALRAYGIKATLYNESPIPAVYRFLPSVELISRQIDAKLIFDTAIVLDCGNLERVGSNASMISGIPAVINIDHHITNNGFGTLQLIDLAACATAEIVYRLVKAMGIEIDKAMGTSIYTGIVTDTGSFRFSNTNHTAFAICDEMVQMGVQPHNVAQHVYGTYSLGRIKLLNLALESIEISSNGNVSMMMLTRQMLADTGTHPEDAAGLINYARRIEDVKMAALIQEQVNGNNGRDGKKQYHVSLRSDGSVDVAAIASGFGGGGHPSAAGFGIKSTLADLKNRIIQLSETL